MASCRLFILEFSKGIALKKRIQAPKVAILFLDIFFKTLTFFLSQTLITKNIFVLERICLVKNTYDNLFLFQFGKYPVTIKKKVFLLLFHSQIQKTLLKLLTILHEN